MSKVANMLNMLQILKDEIYMNSITGRYGGYKIEIKYNSINSGITKRRGDIFYDKEI